MWSVGVKVVWCYHGIGHPRRGDTGTGRRDTLPHSAASSDLDVRMLGAYGVFLMLRYQPPVCATHTRLHAVADSLSSISCFTCASPALVGDAD